MPPEPHLSFLLCFFGQHHRAGDVDLSRGPVEHVEAVVTDWAAPENGHMWPQLPTPRPPPLVQRVVPTEPRADAPASPLHCTWHRLQLVVEQLHHVIGLRVVGLLPRALQLHCLMLPVNGVPWSDVMVAGTPKSATQLATKESATI